MIQIVVPYAFGGGTDVAARIAAEFLPRPLPGANVVVVNWWSTSEGGP